MFCVACGTQQPDGAVFCPRCGRRQEPALEATTHSWASPVVETATATPRIPTLERVKDVGGSVAGALLAIAGTIISLELAAAVAFWTWRTFGPLSLLVTFELWAVVPVWYAWRWVIGHLTGWGWPE